MSLFRPEALIAQTDRLHGDLVLARPLAGWVLGWGAVAVAIALVALLCFGHYTKRATAVGVLTPSSGSLRVLPPSAGVITEVRVREGDRVAAGQVIAVIGDERHLAGAGRLQDALSARLVERRVSLERERSALLDLSIQSSHALRRRLASLRDERAALDKETALLQSRVQYGVRALDRAQQLAGARFVSEQTVQQREEELTELQARLAAAQRSRANLEREQAAAEDELAQQPARSAAQIAALDRALAELGQERLDAAARGSTLVTAPVAGRVTNLLAETGQAIGNQPLATLIPDGARLEAQLFLPSRAVGFVEPGQSVRLRYQAFPYQKFGQHMGAVIRVSRAQLASTELPPALPQLGNGEGLYRITVNLASQQVRAYGKPVALTAGMLVEADIVQDRRRLIEWVFEPLFSLAGKV